MLVFFSVLNKSLQINIIHLLYIMYFDSHTTPVIDSFFPDYNYKTSHSFSQLQSLHVKFSRSESASANKNAYPQFPYQKTGTGNYFQNQTYSSSEQKKSTTVWCSLHLIEFEFFTLCRWHDINSWSRRSAVAPLVVIRNAPSLYSTCSSTVPL